MQEADLAPCGVISSHSKYQQVDLTVPFLMETIELVVPWPEEEDQPAQDESIEPTQPNNKAASAVHPPPEEDARKGVIPREENDIRPPRENVVNAQQCQKSQSGRARNPTRRLIEEG